MKIGVWILVMMGMGGTPLAHAGSTFSSGEAAQVSAHLDFQITIQPSLKVQLALQDERLQAQAETSPGSTLLRQADDQLSEHHLPPSRRHPTRWTSEESAPFTDAPTRLYTFVSP